MPLRCALHVKSVYNRANIFVSITGRKSISGQYSAPQAGLRVYFVKLPTQFPCRQSCRCAQAHSTEPDPQFSATKRETFCLP
ncbi:Uncharacterised protein [Vibrio cholerae]|nr:Uncharacterised protein [Vibrio cholerae]